MTKLRAIGCNSFQIYVIQMGNALPCIFLLVGRQEYRLESIIIALSHAEVICLKKCIYLDDCLSNPMDTIKLTSEGSTPIRYR